MAWKFDNPWAADEFVNPWDINGAEAQKVLGGDAKMSLLPKKKIYANNKENEKILNMLLYYVNSLKDSFDKVHNDTQKNNIEYGFNILSSYSYPLTAVNFLDSITNYAIVAGDVYTSLGAAHINPQMDVYIEDSEDFTLGNSGNQLFLGFIHSHPDDNGLNVCFSPEDIVSLIRMGILIHWGNQFRTEGVKVEDLGKYFVFFVEAPTRRFALVITNPLKVKEEYANIADNAAQPSERTQYFTQVLKGWYYSSLPQTGNLTESSYIDAVKFVLSQLGDDCGILLYKSIDGDKNTFQKA